MIDPHITVVLEKIRQTHGLISQRGKTQQIAGADIFDALGDGFYLAALAKGTNVPPLPLKPQPV